MIQISNINAFKKAVKAAKEVKERGTEVEKLVEEQVILCRIF